MPLFSRGLDVPIRDLSSGFRLYRSAVIREQHITSRDFDVLQQIVVQAFAEGWRVREVPFNYQPREHGSSSARVAPRRHGLPAHVRPALAAPQLDPRRRLRRPRARQPHLPAALLAALAASSRHGAHRRRGPGARRRLRLEPHHRRACRRAASPSTSCIASFATRGASSKPLVRGSGFALPFPDASFPCVLCSQVIEHVPKDSPILDELCRVLAPGGRLVLGTPDYANWQWVYIEKLYGMVPGGYKDEHISHYTNSELVRIMGARGLALEEERYILRGELIQAFRKPAPDQVRTD